ncbi:MULTISPECIES: ParA family protein [Morganellaceae]|uniref:Chromosome partitioning protein ParA n=3 Tax=Morganellaceae TaxID=1903414 RepID=A0A1B8HM98_9GAMM|nr:MULTISPECIES: ParA family protein [Morganellaceae]OBU10543.1 chromosome partitioning protein ParA [Morganella psychrotolerans]QCJ72197.1 ParA family protein [Providencia heimbachae]UNH29075.1 ParA family protein [Moellerella wisconsensis]UNH32654.1 ParA family protein [Moellerella wisconsensis]UNH40614.1 ParA family protein [Moellerella wisconsensis]
MEKKADKPLGKLIVVCSQKGGVVKSQSTNEIAYDLQMAGKKVLMIDADWTTGLTERTFPDELPLEIEREPLKNEFTPGEANTYQLFIPDSTIQPIELKDGRHFLGSTSELNEINYRHSDCMFDFRDRMLQLKEYYDYILIDSAPSYSNVMVASHMAADYLLIPTLLEKQSRNAVAKQITYMQKIKKNYNPKLHFLGTYITQATVSNYSKPLFDGYLGAVDTHNLNMLVEILESKGYNKDYILAYISFAQATAKEAIELGLTFREYDSKSRPAIQYQALAEKIVQLVG